MDSTSDCAVLLRSRRTKRSDIMREMSLSMRVPSVAPCGAVPWVPSNEVQRGNGIGETHEEGGNLKLNSLKDEVMTVPFRCITRKRPLESKPNVHSVRDFEARGCCQS